MIARWQSWPWFLVLQELEGRGWHISLHWFHTCLDTPMEIFTTSWGRPGIAVSPLPFSITPPGARPGGVPMLPFQGSGSGQGHPHSPLGA